MKTKALMYACVLFAFIYACSTGTEPCPTTNQKIEFDLMFSMPRTPNTSLAPGQEFSMNIPDSTKVIITDVYIENLGEGSSHFEILEQRLPNSYEIRYAFNTESKKVTNINFTTGLKLGDEQPIAGKIVIKNDEGSQAHIFARVNGIFVN